MRTHASIVTMAILLTSVPSSIRAVSPPPPPVGTSPGGMVSYQQPTSCQVDPAADSDIVVLSTTGTAGPMVPYAVDPTTVSHLVPVSGSAGRAVTLVLTSQTSVVWDLRAVAAGRIKAIYASGGGAQGLIGAPKDIPVEISGTDPETMYGGGRECGRMPIVNSINDSVMMAMGIRTKFGRYPDRLFAGPNASAFDLDRTKAEVPKSADVKLSEIRTSRPLDPNTPQPAPLILKRMLDDGSIRPFDSELSSIIRSSGGTIEPVTAPTAAPEEPMPAALNSPNLSPEAKRSIMEGFERRRQMRAENMMRYNQNVPNSGIILMKPVDALPSMSGRGGEYGSVIFLPSDVPQPRIAGRYYRMSLKAAEIPTTSGRSGGGQMSRMLEEQPGVVPSIVATWKGDAMTVRMPDTDANGQRRPALSANDPVVAEDSSSMLIPALVAALLIVVAGAAFLLMRGRRRPTAEAPVHAASSGQGPKGNRVEALEVMVQDPELKAAVRTFKDAAMRLIARQDLEADLSGKANDVLQKQFSSLASRYLTARPSADEATGIELDRRMLASLKAMTAQLEAIGAEQNKRNIDALGTGEPA
jgi:hypothetical protein